MKNNRRTSLIMGLGILILIIFSCAFSSLPNTNGQTPLIDSCCKHCVKGKACGDTCININYTCHKPVGCACDY